MQTHLRPAKPGDLCLLVAPDDDGLSSLRQRQFYLQRLFGGQPYEFVHLTCQRFVAPDESLPELQQQLRAQLPSVAPFSIIATSLVNWKSVYTQAQELRWGIALSRDVRNFASVIENILHASGAMPLYVSGWHPTLVTALVGIDYISRDPNIIADVSFPFSLFSARRVLISRITDVVGEYETVDSILLET